jgi:hypothetical protein
VLRIKYPNHPYWIIDNKEGKSVIPVLGAWGGLQYGAGVGYGRSLSIRGEAEMGKAELEDRINGIFAPLQTCCRRSEQDGNGIGYARNDSIMVEQAWIELYQLVESLLE